MTYIEQYWKQILVVLAVACLAIIPPLIVIDERITNRAKPLDFDNIEIVYPDATNHHYEKRCLDGIEYYWYRGSHTPVIDKETLTYVRCENPNAN